MTKRGLRFRSTISWYESAGWIEVGRVRLTFRDGGPERQANSLICAWPKPSSHPSPHPYRPIRTTPVAPSEAAPIGA